MTPRSIIALRGAACILLDIGAVHLLGSTAQLHGSLLYSLPPFSLTLIPAAMTPLSAKARAKCYRLVPRAKLARCWRFSICEKFLITIIITHSR